MNHRLFCQSCNIECTGAVECPHCGNKYLNLAPCNKKPPTTLAQYLEAAEAFCFAPKPTPYERKLDELRAAAAYN